MKTVGGWKAEGKGKYVKQVQAQIGNLMYGVASYTDKNGFTKSPALRAIWGMVLKSDLEVKMFELVPDEEDHLVGVSVTEEMYETIERIRGDIPRGTFLRAITAAGLELLREESE